MQCSQQIIKPIDERNDPKKIKRKIFIIQFNSVFKKPVWLNLKMGRIRSRRHSFPFLAHILQQLHQYLG